MSFIVIAYPKIKQSDFDWLQSYRQANDSRYYSVIEPHVTLVFAISDIDKDSFTAEVKQKLDGIKPFNFEMKVATINQNDDGSYYHEFLVPDTGYSDIVKLHDKLYSGLFAPYLRFDIDYIPHIGIGNNDDAQTSKKRVDDLNTKGVSINGQIDAVTIVEYKDGQITPITEYRL